LGFRGLRRSYRACGLNAANTLTLVAIDCAYPELAADALARSAALLPAARVLLLTDVVIVRDGIEVVQISPIKSRAAYSQFVVKNLGEHIHTDYALVVQWDGFVIDGNAWADECWNYDYIGAKWPHESGDFRVGNGGFSLRSKRLLNALLSPEFTLNADENEDTAICIRHRETLERDHGIVFADERVADRFAFDVGRPMGPTLGFHGVFNFWQVMTADELLGFARRAPQAIVQGIGFAALCKNLVDLQRNDVARAFVQRRLSVLPNDAMANDLQGRLSAAARPDGASVKAPASRNDPCPCGSGKRYKACHGDASAPVAALDVDGLFNEALALHERGDIQAAVARYSRILQHTPEHAGALHFAGLSQYQAGQPSAALELMWRSVKLIDQEPEFFSNISAAAWSAGLYDEGRWAAEKALTLNAEHVGALNNLGFNLRSMNDIEGSIAAFDQALSLAPNFDYARWNRTFSLLAKGDYAQGFADYELRLKFPQTQPPGKIPNAPIWNGDAAPGRTILLMCEQGLGDSFMFARFVPLVAARGLTITFAVPRSQVVLMQQSFPDVRVVALGEHDAMAFDCWAALWSLPAALGITLENLPAPQRFLRASDVDVARWKSRFNAGPVLLPLPGGEGWGEGDGARSKLGENAITLSPNPSPPGGGGQAVGSVRRKRIGLVWQGQFAGLDNQMADRSIPARLMSAFVASHPEITWVSLQHGAPPLAAKSVIDWTADTVEFTQMAALIDSLDLVISIDTGAAHLAAALGAKTWVLLRFSGDWRYGITGDTCAWSPTMRLFRQDESRRWEPVLAQVANALATPERHA
jgi:tetratricopeptide (TPR) repeat protein